MIDLQIAELIKATGETIYMVVLAATAGIPLGLIVGTLLFLSQPGQPLQNIWWHRFIGAAVNIGRSVPFIILLVCLIPLTRWIIGTSIGVNAAVVPLAVATVPFYARITCGCFAELPAGLYETARALAATPWQWVIRFLLPESQSALIRGATLTLISLVGYSAMAGAIGGGGLGELAINYGYERFNSLIILETVVVITALVQFIQYCGDCIASARRLRKFGVAVLVLLGLCLLPQAQALFVHRQHILRVGVMNGQDVRLLQVAKRVALKKYGLHVQVVGFDDYVQPNVALNNGSIDANIFQHKPYLDAQIKAHGYRVVPVAKTFVYPFGFYSKKIHALDELKRGDVVALPNDPSNEGRALLLLAKHHLISINRSAGLFATPADIVSNPYGLLFKELNAAQVARSLPDVALGGLTNDYAKPAGFNVSEAVLRESADSPYANLVVVRLGHQHNKAIQQLIASVHSKAFLQATQKAFPGGAAIAAFSIKGVK